MSPDLTTLTVLAALTAVCATALTPVARSMLTTAGVWDVPSERSSHSLPTIRGGGVACLMATLLAWAVGSVLGLNMPHACLAAAVLMSLVGLADDLWKLPARHRLVAQIVLGAGLGAVLGGLGTVLMGAVVFPVAVNAVNFMDGINGLTGLVVMTWASVVVLGGISSGSGASVIAALAFGAAIGFLPWNAPEARIFLGDSGSYLFGGLIASAVLTAQAVADPYWLIVAPLSLYLFDTGFTLLRRAARGAPLSAAHREHFYQRIGPARGWGHLEVSASIALLSLAIGWTTTTLSLVPALVALVTGILTYAWMAVPTLSTDHILGVPTSRAR